MLLIIHWHWDDLLRASKRELRRSDSDVEGGHPLLSVSGSASPASAASSPRAASASQEAVTRSPERPGLSGEKILCQAAAGGLGCSPDVALELGLRDTGIVILQSYIR